MLEKSPLKTDYENGVLGLCLWLPSSLPLFSGCTSLICYCGTLGGCCCDDHSISYNIRNKMDIPRRNGVLASGILMARGDMVEQFFGVLWCVVSDEESSSQVMG